MPHLQVELLEARLTPSGLRSLGSPLDRQPPSHQADHGQAATARASAATPVNHRDAAGPLDTQHTGDRADSPASETPPSAVAVAAQQPNPGSASPASPVGPTQTTAVSLPAAGSSAGAPASPVRPPQPVGALAATAAETSPPVSNGADRPFLPLARSSPAFPVFSAAEHVYLSTGEPEPLALAGQLVQAAPDLPAARAVSESRNREERKTPALVPQLAGLLVDGLPVEAQAVEQALQLFLNQMDHPGAGHCTTEGGNEPALWLVAAALAGIACAVASRQLRQPAQEPVLLYPGGVRYPWTRF